MTQPPVIPLLVSREAVASAEPYDIVLSNIEVVNELADLLSPDELNQAALTSYYTDFYYAQVRDGGFALFVYNSGWSPLVLDAVAAGLDALDATRQAEVFAKARDFVDTLTEDELQGFFESDPFGENELRDRINAAAAGFQDAEADVVERNAAYLRGNPALVAVPEEQLADAIEDVFAALPDRAEREAALEAMPEPEYIQIIEALCELAEEELERVTAGTPTEDGEIIWHFLTDKGARYYTENDGEAVMFDAEGDTELARVFVLDEVIEEE